MPQTITIHKRRPIGNQKDDIAIANKKSKHPTRNQKGKGGNEQDIYGERDITTQS